jgi:hypothetical protein
MHWCANCGVVVNTLDLDVQRCDYCHLSVDGENGTAKREALPPIVSTKLQSVSRLMESADYYNKALDSGNALATRSARERHHTAVGAGNE